MNATFLADDPMNSTLVDLAGGGHLYDITTEHQQASKDVRSTTTIRNPSGKVVAVWERTYRRMQDRIMFHNSMHVLGEWLPKKSPISKTRILFGPDGKRYHWKLATGWGSKTLKLIEPESACVVAEVRSARFGSGPFSLSSPRRMSLFVTPEVVPMLDAIVLSLIVLQQEIKEQSFQGQYTASGGVMAGATIVC